MGSEMTGVRFEYLVEEPRAVMGTTRLLSLGGYSMCVHGNLLTHECITVMPALEGWTWLPRMSD